MTERKRRNLCRAGFLVFCVLPTLAIAMGVALPSSDKELAARWSDRLGVDVRIAETTRAAPGVTKWTSVTLTDRERGPIARAAEIATSNTDRGHVLLATDPELELEQLDRAYEILHDQILRRLRPTDDVITFRSERVTLNFRHGGADGAPSRITLYDVIGGVEPLSDGARFSLSFHPAADSSSRCELQIDRRRPSGACPSTTWTFDTKQNRMPCRWLSGCLGQLDRLGKDCEFRGMIWLEQDSETWQADVNGEFRNVDLRELVQQQFPHLLTGQATIEFVRGKFRDGRLVDAAGSITADNGLIGTSLLEAAVDSLHLKLVSAAAGESRRYRQLAIGFQIDGSRLTLSGQCAAVRRALLVDEFGGPLLVETSAAGAPSLALARMLVARSEFQVPLTQETSGLLSIFPAPTVKQP